LKEEPLLRQSPQHPEQIALEQRGFIGNLLNIGVYPEPPFLVIG
jgi:hypothetical protein